MSANIEFFVADLSASGATIALALETKPFLDPQATPARHPDGIKGSGLRLGWKGRPATGFSP